MRRVFLRVVVLALLTIAPAHANKPANKGLIGHAVEPAGQGYYGMAGCGLGSVLFGETDHRGGQVLAATTNGIYSNHTFGVSSGTSNCVPEKSAHRAQIKKNVELFVAANREALANDIVKSNGETIFAVGEIIGCKDTNYLGAKLQSRYQDIFNSKQDVAVAENMWTTVSTDRYLIENCKL